MSRDVAFFIIEMLKNYQALPCSELFELASQWTLDISLIPHLPHHQNLLPLPLPYLPFS